MTALPDEVRQAVAPPDRLRDPSAAPLRQQDVRRFQTFRERLALSPTAQERIGVPLASIHGSDLARYDYLGFIPEDPRKEGPWTILTRVFLRPDGEPVFLFEWDFPADGGSIVVLEEFINETVGRTPARLMVKRSEDGRAVSERVWTTAHRDLKLSTWGDVLAVPPGSPYDKAWFKGIAEALAEP